MLATGNFNVKFMVSIDYIGFSVISAKSSEIEFRLLQLFANASDHHRAPDIRQPHGLCYSELPPCVSKYG